MVDGTALADILDDLQSGLALADSLSVEDLVDTAWVFTFAPLSNCIIDVARRALTTNSVNTIVAVVALAKHGCETEVLVDAASVAVIVGAGGDVGWGFAVMAVRPGQDRAQQTHQQKTCFQHGLSLFG